MTDDDQPDGLVPDVEQADGSFYHAYKKQLSELIDTIEFAGIEALKNTSIQGLDRWELEQGVGIIRRGKKELLGLLSKIINESSPSYFEEFTVETITNVVSGIFKTSKHVHLTDSAVQEALKKQAGIARAARKPKLSKAKADRIELVRRHASLVGADLQRPYKAAEAILGSVNLERAQAGKPNVTVKTIQNWINEAALGENSEIS